MIRVREINRAGTGTGPYEFRGNTCPNICRGRSPCRPDFGFTLVELVITLVVISIGVVGILLAVATMIRYSADPVVQYQTVAIGGSYLEEIMAKQFPISVPCSGTPFSPRANATNICDYNNLNEVPTDQNGTSLGLNNYNVRVNIVTNTAALGSLVSGSQVVRIDVTVTPPNATPVVFSGYRTNHQ